MPNPAADFTVELVTDNADQKVQVIGDQVLTATAADVGKVVTVAADGTLELVSGTPPAGAAGGVLAGTYPDPSFAADMATQAELDAAAAAAQAASQPLDADLTAIAALTTTAFGRSVLAAADAGALAKLASDSKWPSGTLLLPSAPLSTLGLTDQRLYYIPLWVPEARTTSALNIESTVAGVGGSPTVRVGIYTAHATTGKPDQLVVDAGAIDVTLAPGELTKALTQALTPGLYWFAAVAQGATVTQPTLRAVTGYSRYVNPAAIGATRSGYFQSGVSGALPATATPSEGTITPFVSPKAV